MEEVILKIKEYAPLVMQLLGALVISATVIVKLTPSPKDDEMAHGFAGKFFKFLSYLPTIGINPRTKKLEEAYNDLKNPK